MASYKVPQDVEADDKLIGPFSFRQFIYLIIVAMAVAMAWGLAQIFIGLAVIPLPVVLLFGALALPLRKDQPMEIYLAAIISFYLKPNRRVWDPEGVESTVEITAPKTAEVKRTKDLSEGEAAERLSYLATLVDTQGWSIRGVTTGQNIAMNTDVVLEAQGVQDVLDTNTSVAANFSHMMQESTDRLKEEARQRMLRAATPVQVEMPVPSTSQSTLPTVEQAPVIATPIPVAQPVPQPLAPEPTLESVIEVPTFNPYPTIQQSVIQPLNQDDRVQTPQIPAYAPEEVTPPPVTETPATTSEIQPSADIIELANNTDLSIQTIAREAHRLQKKAEEESDEVIISLR